MIHFLNVSLFRSLITDTACHTKPSQITGKSFSWALQVKYW
ncbi:hypothetical protein FGIG_12543 [Fasciola gigantica]|uniref:Uncharacterized protein n=1 Tax=Fasciola gigantica TaxID=46835 RepID=A0A504Z2I7_FASGI|nr:hypothetical protein FGIG_12543 [Fasciola gigantica]